jgi:hypothetical protein
MHLQSIMRQYRSKLEAEVVKVRGNVSLIDAHLIDAAVSHHMMGYVTRRALAAGHAGMTQPQLVNAFSEYCSSKERRNKAIMQLRLESVPQVAVTTDPVMDFYSDLNADEITNGSPTIAPSEPEGPGSTSESPSAPDALEGLLGDDTNDSTNGA